MSSPPLQGMRPGHYIPPRATYRLQINGQFTLRQAEAIVPYLARLGISHLYLSPLLKSRPGSAHGYDVTDHASLNPEIGSTDDFHQLVSTARSHGLALLLDIVPNHMAVMADDNAWWLDVLENGPAAEHAPYFDIDWFPIRSSMAHRMLVPVLGQQYGRALEAGELSVHFNAEQGSFSVHYFEHRFPLDPREYPKIFMGAPLGPDEVPGADVADLQDFESLLAGFASLPPAYDTTEQSRAERYRDKEVHKRRLSRLCARSPAIEAYIHRAVSVLNGKPGESASFDTLDALLRAQSYRLSYWRVAGDEVNYRRFFDVNHLAALRMDNPRVFADTHRLILEWVAAGDVDGLRIDHPDGLYDPQEYLQRLQAPFQGPDTEGQPIYVVVEKILAPHERLPEQWPVAGTTGYEFAALLNAWLTDPEGERPLDRIYRAFAREGQPYEDIVYESKKYVMQTSLAAEVAVLATQLDRIAQASRYTADFTRYALRDAIIELIANFPVYRSYISERGASTEDRRFIEWGLNVARTRSRSEDLSVFDFLHEVLLVEAAHAEASKSRASLEFAMKFQQVTSAVTAKGVEDTAFYRYCRLVSLNEVGGSPTRFSLTHGGLHQANQERARRWPNSMLATSTHDTKRSEDVRARIAVLSEMPELWRRHLSRWTRINRSKHKLLNDEPAPSRNDEYLIYQTLLGIWPPREASTEECEDLRKRLVDYALKAGREAKVHTSWTNPSPEYEEALESFVSRLLEASSNNAFRRDFEALVPNIAYFGALNSLSQTALKLTCPGVPDLYQGTELPQLSLVDPDNRRPVRYSQHAERLEDLRNAYAENPIDCIRDLLESWHDGRVKLLLTWRLLALRAENPLLFAEAKYEPLTVSGERSEHLLAFARVGKERRAVIAVPRCMAKLMNMALEPPLGKKTWVDTRIELPAELKGFEWRNWITGTTLGASDEIDVGQALSTFPIAVLLAESESDHTSKAPE